MTRSPLRRPWPRLAPRASPLIAQRSEIGEALLLSVTGESGQRLLLGACRARRDARGAFVEVGAGAPGETSDRRAVSGRLVAPCPQRRVRRSHGLIGPEPLGILSERWCSARGLFVTDGHD